MLHDVCMDLNQVNCNALYATGPGRALKEQSAAGYSRPVGLSFVNKRRGVN